MEIDPGNPACLAGLGQALAAQERYADAEGAFREAMEIDPDNPGHPAKLGLVLLKTGELPRAASILRELQQLYPDTADTSAADLQRAVSEAYDDAIVSHACDLADRLSDKLDLRRRGIAWHEYQAHIPIIARSQLKDLRTIYRDWSDARSHEESEPEGTHSSARSYRIRIIGSLCLLAAALATGGSLATDSVPAIPGEARHIAEILSLAVAILGVALPMICLRRYRQGIPQAFRASLALEDQLASLISNLVLEPAVTTAIQVSWKDSAVDRVSVRDGDELSAKAEIANLISTAAKGRLAIALNRRHGAAVALAGPRGSGKTELARMFTELRPPEPPSRKIPLMLWPPAQCDAHTFLLRVLKDLCIGISSIRSGNGKNHERFFYPERRRQRYSQSIIAGGLMGLGLTVLVTRIAEVKISTVIPFMIGCILIVGGVTVLVASRRPQRLRSRVDAPIRRSTIERAAELVTRVEFTDTYTRDAQLGISGYGLSASAKQGSQFARVPLNEIDVVREIRAMVQSVAEEGWQVIIAIDELDKMRDAEEAMAFLDHIKVLFPIHGCSFIVSVSEDAWARFESRGMPRRDTFDSSFDEVVRVKMLTPAESRDFLKRRSSSITDAQALFCHCLSGGLPRDLIRAARLLAHVASRARDKEGSDPPLCDVLTILLWENLEDKLAASGFFARGDRGVGAPIMTPWLDVWPDQEKTERLLADICRSRGQNKSAALSQVASPDPEPEASHQDHIEAYIAVLHTIRQAFWPGGPLTLLGNEPPDSERLLKGFHCIASARWSQASDIGIAWELLHEARRTLKLAPLDTVAAHPAVGSQ
jgi:tetratricopeptide (TPR) repeat protein/energy-coupling factor transporter ATP-binding protein EcfA2